MTVKYPEVWDLDVLFPGGSDSAELRIHMDEANPKLDAFEKVAENFKVPAGAEDARQVAEVLEAVKEVMLVYLAALILLYLQYRNHEQKLTERLPVSINLAWISVATITNISYVLTYHNWSGWGLSNELWAVILLTVATALALHVRFHHSDIPFAAVFVWAFIGIAVKHGFSELLVTTASLFLSGVIITGVLLIKKNKVKN